MAMTKKTSCTGKLRKVTADEANVDDKKAKEQLKKVKSEIKKKKAEETEEEEKE